MERLTISNSNGSVSVPALVRERELAIRLAAYEDTGLEPEEIGKLKTAYDENHDPSSLVKRGRWEEITTHNGCTFDYDCVCSCCGESGVPSYKFCPSCGARMQED